MGEGEGPSAHRPLPRKFLHHPFHQPRRGGGGQGEDELGFGDGLVDEVGGLKDGGQVPLDFAGPAAGEQGDGEGLRVQAVPRPGRSAGQ